MRVLTYRAAVACVVIAGVLSLLFYQRVFFGSGAGSFVNFYDVFYTGQWAAVLFAIVGLACCIAAWKNGQSPSRVWVVLGFDVALLILAMVKGVPHRANRTEWRRGALGVVHYFRGAAKQRAENAPPKQVSADTFAGSWRGPDGSVYTFSPDRLVQQGSSVVEYTRANCGPSFALEYIERDREALQDLGLTWSEHAFAVYNSTAVSAKIPVANFTCGQEMAVFIRASPGEVWRVTSTLELDAIKAAAFVLQRVADAAKQ